ncbi:ABC transporter transmembrane domain-containing protein [Tomitella fengzijianii]|uniref:ABC transporter transmembrane domain-containing protein n=1 Tax=Tomitella fengzijianii TaxID=2597660 RepID=UPI00131E167F|nr:ABC transporter ATP-binding protein [Tomitella fengzijianii]
MNRLPRLLAGRRRATMAMLVGTGLLMAATTVASALLLQRLLEIGTGAGRPQSRYGGAALLAGLLGTVVALGALRAADRVLAEMLGQDYIHSLRVGLVRAALTMDRGPSPGVTIARATNDLSSVRNWISMGIAPLAVGAPLVAGTATALWLVQPVLAIAVAVPLLVSGAAMALLAGPAYRRARELRRRRGRLAAALADTILAAPGIRMAGGVHREVAAIDRAGRSVVGAAVRRSATAGLIRGAAAAAAAGGAAAVAAVGVWQGVSTATIASALMIVGILSGPLTDMGRAVEYRQNFRAARRILAPVLDTTDSTGSGGGDARPEAVPAAGSGSVVIGLPESRGSITAHPGDRVLVRCADPAARTRLVQSMLIGGDSGVEVTVDGTAVADAGQRALRALVGYAASGTVFERGTVARAVRYRRPDLPPAAGTDALDAAGLTGTVAGLARGERTILKQGGRPLSASERARLALARATLGAPPLLVIDGLRSDLDAEGADLLTRTVSRYPGVVLFCADGPRPAVTGAGAVIEWWIDAPPSP